MVKLGVFLTASALIAGALVAGAAIADPLLLPAVNDPVITAELALEPAPTPAQPKDTAVPLAAAPVESQPTAARGISQPAARAPVSRFGAAPRKIRVVSAPAIRFADAAPQRSRRVASLQLPIRSARACDSILCPQYVLIGVGF